MVDYQSGLNGAIVRNHAEDLLSTEREFVTIRHLQMAAQYVLETLLRQKWNVLCCVLV